MKLISKVTEIYCIADDFCKEYELELNKKALGRVNQQVQNYNTFCRTPFGGLQN